MVTATDDGDDVPEEERLSESRADDDRHQFDAETWRRLTQAVTTTAMQRAIEDTQSMGRWWLLRQSAKRDQAARGDQHVVQAAAEVNNVFIAHATGEVRPAPGGDANTGVALAGKPSLAEQRQAFHFDFLKHAMKQAEWTFRLSVWFMTAGAVVILVAAVLALVHAGNSNGYVPLVTGLSGVLITSGGGALALHSKRTMANLTKAAEANEAKIDADHQLETATTFIDRVEDKDAKDRLNSAAALKALNIQPDPDTMLNRLLPGDQPKEIEPGDPTN